MAITVLDLDVAVRANYLPNIINNAFKATPLLRRLIERKKVLLKGGFEIRQPFMYDKLPGGSFSGSGPFDVSYKQTHTWLKWDWKNNYVDVTIPGVDMAKADSPEEVIGLLDPKMEAAGFTIKDNLSKQLYGDGTGNAAQDMDGLANAVDDGTNYPTYGGQSRADIPKLAANLNAVGGAFSFDMMQASYGSATDGDEAPDLIVSSQSIWDKAWARSQPQQRIMMGESTAEVGFNAIRYNGAIWLPDNYCPAGTIFGLNTKYIELIINSNMNFLWTPPKSGTNEYAYIRQLLVMSNLICTAPWRQFQIQNVT
jgi:hypothetical protein